MTPDDLVVLHRRADSAVRVVLSPNGIEDLVAVTPSDQDRVDVIVDRPAAACRGDRLLTWDAERLATATRLTIESTPGLTPWGLPERSRIARAIPVKKVLRFHGDGSPFGGRPLSIDLVTSEDELATRVAQGSADLHARASWSSILAWLATPEALFGDVFPDLIDLRGELALLSMFEGLLWEALAPLPRFGSVLQRWGRCWASMPVRRDLAALAWPT